MASTIASQTTSEHPNKLAFEEGVDYVFNNWTALKLAVEQDWGGVESVEKKEWLIETIIDHFSKCNTDGKRLEIYDVEDILAQVMSDEFNVTLEDDSPYLIAKHLIDLYRRCIKGDFSEVERLREKSKQKNDFAASSCIKQGDDSDEEGDDDNNNFDNDNGSDGDEDGDDTMEEVAPKEPLVDEDGWETVRRK